MTDEQRRKIIDCYNAAQEQEGLCLIRMGEAETAESAAQDERHLRRAMDRWAKASAKHSFALGTMNGISMALESLGYSLIVDDCDRALDIKPEEG